MSSRTKHGKRVDKSTPWSGWLTYKGRWYRERYNSKGDYKREWQQPTEEIPRTPGELPDPQTYSSQGAMNSDDTPRYQQEYESSETQSRGVDGTDNRYGGSSYQSYESHSKDPIAESTDTSASSPDQIPEYYEDYQTLSPHSSSGVYNDDDDHATTSAGPSRAADYNAYEQDDYGGSSTPVAYTHSSTNSNIDTLDSVAVGFRSMTLAPLPEEGWYSTATPKYPTEPRYISSEPGYGKGETLDPRYQEVPRDSQKKFWKVGRVFVILWTEPARPPLVPQGGGSRNGSYLSTTNFSTTRYGGVAYSEIRRYVVMRVGHGSNLCCPIQTYKGQGTLKDNLPEPQKHTIIYTTTTPPYELSYEAADGSIVRENLNKDPIRVNKADDYEEDLHPASRLNYSKIYCVENYHVLRNIGMVDRKSMPSLEANSLLRPTSNSEPVQRPHRHPPRAESGKSRESKGKESQGKESKESKHRPHKDKSGHRDKDKDKDSRNRKH